MRLDERQQIFTNVQLKNLMEVGEAIITFAEDQRILLFVGEMGAGKTTLIKAVGKCLGVTDTIHSPTFGIVNEYKGNAISPAIYHFDFYRLKNETEAYAIGVEDYFYSNNYCLIEWPEKIPTLIPANHVKITLQAEDEEHRTIAIAIHDGEEKIRV